MPFTLINLVHHILKQWHEVHHRHVGFCLLNSSGKRTVNTFRSNQNASFNAELFAISQMLTCQCFMISNSNEFIIQQDAVLSAMFCHNN
ncbi:hypothetical protein D3C71_1530230 [compost metagenome]